ncbi:MSC_0624 family F1-like ATPase-associated membrane protein [Mycoplasma hafezii]|uniref:MSC_0624 family F1-like ATPase-associated membrane protein n=1 Tax=Mycoplasma hafezii TaxID=525886 RepID=UPI003CF3D92C
MIKKINFKGIQVPKAGILILFAAISLFTFLNLSQYIGSQTITPDSTEKYLGFERLFDFTNQVLKARNFAILTNFILLFSSFVLGCYFSYQTLLLNIKKMPTVIFIALYTIISLGALVYLNLIKINITTNAVTLIYPFLIFIGVLLVKWIFNLFFVAKQVKNYASYKLLYSSSFIAQTLLLIFVVAFTLITYVTIKNVTDIDLIFNGEKNNNYQILDSWFNTMNNKSWITIIVLVVYLTITFGFKFYPYVAKKTSKYSFKNFVKNTLPFAIISLFTMLVFLLINLKNLSFSTNTLFNSSFNYYGVIIFGVIYLVVILGYLLTNYLIIKKQFAKVLIKLNFYLFFAFLAISSLIYYIFNFDYINNYLNTLLLVISAIVLYVIFRLQTKLQLTKYIICWNWKLILLNFVALFEVINLMMITSNNPVFSSIFVLFSINEVLVTAMLLIALIPLIWQIGKWIRAIIIIKNHQKKESQNEQIMKEN